MKLTAPSSVSVIIRTIGHPSLLRAIDAALGQTWPAVQVLVVAARPGLDLSRCEAGNNCLVVPTEKSLDRPQAGNVGLENATGDWLLILDEDDWIDAGHVEKLLSPLLEQEGILLAYSDMVVHKSDQPFVRSLGYWKQGFSDQPFFTPQAALFSRRLVDFGCRFDEQFVLLEDWDFFLQCAEFTDFVHVPSASAHYDPHAGTSGGGIGINRNETRISPYVQKLTKKWGARYAGITLTAERALEEVDHLFANKEFSSAHSILDKALRNDPGNPLLLNRLAACFRVVGDVAGMVRSLRRACDSDRRAVRMHMELAVLEHKLGYLEKALQLATHAKEVASTDEERSRVGYLISFLTEPGNSRQGGSAAG
jgi:glycosyltransferase involved in cell wall biosynthesis